MPAQRTRDTLSHSLEVTTDAPQPPTLSIISPTPRAFTFPINHSVTDSPFSSPSSSPFEPDLRPLALTCVTPPSSEQSTLLRSLSPISPIRTPSPTTSKRRKSSCSSEMDHRRPKKGDEDYVKRPENAFILFRRKCCEDRQAQQAEAAAGSAAGKRQRQADLSKTISQQWKSLSSEDRQYWEDLAKEKKKEHEQMYPNYVYRPQRSKDKDARSKARKAKGIRGEYEHETDSESIAFVLPFPGATPFTRRHGRSASAPTPPLPYQSIQLPNIYMPSCPTSPSLMPLINRRTSHPHHPHTSMAQFDFLPGSNLHNGLMAPPSFGQAGEFEASLQPEFFTGMFMPQANRSQLQPLNMMDHAAFLQQHQMISPTSSVGSGSSGPSSPHTGPFTPASAFLAQLSTYDFEFSPHDSAPAPSDAEIQSELQLQQDLYSSFSWDNSAPALWQTQPNEMLVGEDFDLSAIPPIELGLPKFGEDAGPHGAQLGFSQEFTAQYQHHEDGQGIDAMFGFDDMMSRHGF